MLLQWDRRHRCFCNVAGVTYWASGWFVEWEGPVVERRYVRQSADGACDSIHKTRSVVRRTRNRTSRSLHPSLTVSSPPVRKVHRGRLLRSVPRFDRQRRRRVRLRAAAARRDPGDLGRIDHRGPRPLLDHVLGLRHLPPLVSHLGRRQVVELALRCHWHPRRAAQHVHRRQGRQPLLQLGAQRRVP
jgi:hypothetical protein